MIAALLFLAAFSRVDLIDENVEIPASDWRYVPRPVTQEPAQVDCNFQSDRPDAKVRVVLLSHADLNAWRDGRDHDETATTAVGSRGMLRIPVHDVDSYLAIENRGTRPVRVRLRVFLEQPQVRYLSRGRQLAVILISFSVFFAIVSLSARRILNGIRR
jgi:hypothetical protein